MNGRFERTMEPLRRLPASERLPGGRLIRLGSGSAPELAGASSTDVIGASVPSDSLHAVDAVRIAMRSAVASMFIEGSGAVTLGPVFQAADGKVASSGSVRFGVAITEATDDLVEVVPD